MRTVIFIVAGLILAGLALRLAPAAHRALARVYAGLVLRLGVESAYRPVAWLHAGRGVADTHRAVRYSGRVRVGGVVVAALIARRPGGQAHRGPGAPGGSSRFPRRARARV